MFSTSYFMIYYIICKISLRWGPDFDTSDEVKSAQCNVLFVVLIIVVTMV